MTVSFGKTGHSVSTSYGRVAVNVVIAVTAFTDSSAPSAPKFPPESALQRNEVTIGQSNNPRRISGFISPQVAAARRRHSASQPP